MKAMVFNAEKMRLLVRVPPEGYMGKHSFGVVCVGPPMCHFILC